MSKKEHSSKKAAKEQALDSPNWVSESTLAQNESRASPSASSSPKRSPSPGPGGGVSLSVVPGILCCGVGEKITSTAAATGEGASDKDVTLTWPGGSKTGKGTVTHVYTVTQADCGAAPLSFTGNANGKTKSAKVPVVKITTLAFADAPDDKERKKLGVCEDVEVTLTPKIGRVRWKLKGKGKLSSVTQHTILFFAPNRAAVTTLEGTLTTTAAETGVKKSITCSVTFTTIEPNGISMKQLEPSELWHRHDLMSAGACAEVRILPTDVSFYRIQVREGVCVASAAGFFAPYNGVLIHQPGPWMTVEVGTNEFPSIMTGHDRIAASKQQNVPPWGPYGPGTFLWPIPWYFKCDGDNKKQFTTSNHRMISTSAGTLRITKSGLGFSRELEDPDSDLECCDNPA